MNNFFEQLKNEGHKIRLSHAEKAAMKARILSLPAQAAAPSPYFFFSYQFMQRAFVPLLAVLVVLGGSGTAYAAEGSLPGDTLYTFKVGVSEPLRAALALGHEARAEVHIALAQRRVEEAEALAARGALNAEATAALEKNFEEHMSTASELALEVGHQDPSAAVELNARAHSAISVHGAILAALSERAERGDSKENSGVLAARVVARANAGTSRTATAVALKTMPAAEDARVETMSFTATAPAEDTTATASPDVEEPSREDSERENKLKERAEAALKKAHERYEESKPALEAEAIARLDAQFARADSLQAQGDFGAALELAVKLTAVIEAQKKYRTDVITPLLKLQLDINTDRD